VTRLGRLMIGAITTGALVFLGVLMLAGHRWVWGGVCLALALVRLVVLVRQWREE